MNSIENFWINQEHSLFWVLCLIPPFLWAAVNHLDKYLVGQLKNDGHEVGPLIILSGLAGIMIMPIVPVIQPSVILVTPKNALVMVVCGIVYVAAIVPYLYAMQYQEATRLVPIFQTVPVFAFLLAFFWLDESLTQTELIGGGIILLGAIWISMELKTGVGFHLWPFLLMVLASFLFALNFFLFKSFAIKNDFWTVAFWEYTGLVIAGCLLLIYRPYRQGFLEIIRTSGKRYVSLSILAEGLNITAKVLMCFLMLLAPIAVVSVFANGSQMVIVFFLGVIMTHFFPSLGKEEITLRSLAQKMSAIAIILAGMYILQM